MMKKCMLVIILCFVLATVSGCGQKEAWNSGEQRANSSLATAVSIETADASENAEFPDESESFEEDPYAIYQRFLEGEEPLYFREDTIFSRPSGNYRYQVETEQPYEFYEICNIINVTYNSSAPVNELSNNISYAFIDCGMDGDAELAVLFHDLEDCDDPEDVTLVIKDVDGRLELCYLIQPYYRETWLLANAYGWIDYDCMAGSGVYSIDRGYICADGVYRMVYSELDDYNFYWALPYDISSEILDDTMIVLKTYTIGEDESGREYNLLTVESQSLGASSVDMDSLSQAVADVTGMEFYSYEEIQTMIADREVKIGLTEEIKNGPEVEWIPVDEKGYDLIYGVESASGVSDNARAIEAYRRFLSDKGHFKEVLEKGVLDDGLEIVAGKVEGFFIKDLDNDGIPELLIGMQAMRVGQGSQEVFIYTFDPESGRVNLVDMIKGKKTGFGCDAETYEEVVSVYPEFADTFFYTNKYVQEAQGPFRVGYNSAGQLVWFDHGVNLGNYRCIYYKNYGVSEASSYCEDGGVTEYVYYEEAVGSKEDAIKAMQGYRPFLFYDVTEENIDRYVVEDYLGAGMETYSRQDIIDNAARMDRFCEEIYRQHVLSPTSSFAGGGYSRRSYNIDYLVQLYY